MHKPYPDRPKDADDEPPQHPEKCSVCGGDGRVRTSPERSPVECQRCGGLGWTGQPTKRRPGSLGKQDVVMQRYALGLCVWHPDDLKPDQETAYSGTD